MRHSDIVPIFFLFSCALYLGITLSIEGSGLITGGFSYSCPTDSAPCQNPYYNEKNTVFMNTQTISFCEEQPNICSIETIQPGDTLGTHLGPLSRNASDVITILSIPLLIFSLLLFLEKKQLLRVI